MDARLTAYFAHFAPKKQGDVPKLLSSWAGREEQLFAELGKKYGTHPNEFNPDDPPPLIKKKSSKKMKGSAAGGGGGEDTKSGNPYRDRLRRLWAKYAPEKTEADIDKALGVWAGKEEEMFEKLVKKYGPEPAAPNNSGDQSPRTAMSPAASSSNLAPSTSGTTAPPGGAGGSSVYRDRLRRLWAKYAPEKTEADIDKALGIWAGKEDEMFEKLVKKYGPEPPANESAQKTPTSPKGVGERPKANNAYRDRLRRLWGKYAPEKTEADIDKALGIWAGKEEEMFEKLVKKYGPEPAAIESQPTAASPTASQPASSSTAPSNNYRERLRRLWAKYAPEKTEADIDKALGVWVGKEEEMFEKLVKKYGPEPAASSSPTGGPTPASAPSTVSSSNSYRDRLRRLWAKYAPEKTEADIDKALGVWAGKEEEMFEKLVKKYGPEPLEATAVEHQPRSANPSNHTAMPVQTNVDNNSYRNRLKRLWAKYAPEKTEADIDKALSVWAGKEEEMFEKLVKKYGPEPPAPENATTAVVAPQGGTPPQQPHQDTQPQPQPGELQQPRPTQPQQPATDPYSYRERLRKLWAKYAPEKTEADIDKALSVWAGKEDQMMEKLVQKYGPEPPLPHHELPPRDRLRRLWAKYAPEKTEADIDKALSVWAGKEEEMFEKLVKKYGPEPPLEPQPQPTTIAPSQGAPSASNQDSQPTTNAHFDPQDSQSMGGSYKDEPSSPPHPQQSTPQGNPFSSANPMDTSQQQPQVNPHQPRERLRRLWAKYAPEKTEADLDKALGVWAGKEEEMFEKLVKKYGPEPPIPDERQTGAVGAGQSQPQGTPTPTTTAATAVAPHQSSGDYRGDLITLFRQYAPDHVLRVDQLLEEHSDAQAHLVRSLYAHFGVPYISVDAEKTASNLGGAYPVLNPAQQRGIVGRGHLTLRVISGRDLPVETMGGVLYDDAPVASDYDDPEHNAASVGPPAVGLLKRHNFHVGMVFSGKELFESPPVVNERTNISWESKTSAQYLLLVDGTSYLLTLLIYRDGYIVGECRVSLTALPSEGTTEFQVAGSKMTTDPQLRDRVGRLGYITLAWSFVSADDSAAISKSVLQDKRMSTDNDSSRSRAAASGAAFANFEEIDPWTQRIAAFYCRHMPEKIADVEAVRKQYETREVELLDALCIRFGPEPDPTDFRTRVEAMFYRYESSRVRESKVFALQCAGREDFVIKMLVKKYGPESPVKYTCPPVAVRAPHPLSDRDRIRLTRWLMLRFPRRAAEVDYLLVRFSGRERLMFRMLQETLGPEPSDEPVKETVRSRYLTTPALSRYFSKRKAPPFLSWMWSGNLSEEKSQRMESQFSSEYIKNRNRLERFYHHYNPIKVGEVESTLQRWKGREDLLFEALVHKYGAEPASDVPIRDTPIQQQPSRALHPGQAMTNDPHNSGYGGRRNPRRVLEDYYALHNPEKIKDIEETLQRFQGRDDTLYKLLEAKYGADPLRAAPQQPTAYQIQQLQQNSPGGTAGVDSVSGDASQLFANPHSPPSAAQSGNRGVVQAPPHLVELRGGSMNFIPPPSKEQQLLQQQQQQLQRQQSEPEFAREFSSMSYDSALGPPGGGGSTVASTAAYVPPPAFNQRGGSNIGARSL